MTAKTAKSLSDTKKCDIERDIVEKLKEIVIRKAYSGEYSGAVYLPPQTPLTIVKRVAELFVEKGYKAIYNTTIITLTWT